MSLFAQLAVVAFIVAVVDAQTSSGPVRLPAVVVNETTPGSCPSDDTLGDALMSAKRSVNQAFLNAPCGGLGWTQVAFLDMGDTSSMCPAPWTETPTPQRSCLAANNNNCLGLTYPVPGAYTRVCGRLFGYSVNTPDGFFTRQEGIDQAYLDGISLTYGSPRQHIWSFGVGHGDRFGAQNIRCPCANADRNAAPLPPAFVGDNYYCDNLNNGGELWDAQDCTNACCTFNDPPVFNTALSAPTTDGIEVRICSDQNAGDETVHLRLLQLYVQ